MQRPDSDVPSAVDVAAAWLASEKEPPHPIVPSLRRRFNLSAAEAIAAIREANLSKARSH